MAGGRGGSAEGRERAGAGRMRAGAGRMRAVEGVGGGARRRGRGGGGRRPEDVALGSGCGTSKVTGLPSSSIEDRSVAAQLSREPARVWREPRGETRSGRDVKTAAGAFKSSVYSALRHGKTPTLWGLRVRRPARLLQGTGCRVQGALLDGVCSLLSAGTRRGALLSDRPSELASLSLETRRDARGVRERPMTEPVKPRGAVDSMPSGSAGGEGGGLPVAVCSAAEAAEAAEEAGLAEAEAAEEAGLAEAEAEEAGLAEAEAEAEQAGLVEVEATLVEESGLASVTLGGGVASHMSSVLEGVEVHSV